LWDELFCLADGRTYIPHGSGLTKAVLASTPMIELHGWMVTTGRSAVRRWLEFVRA
jgi:hypothetical protein